MDERNLHNNAVCTESVARACSDLAAIEDAMPKMPEKDLIRAHQSARALGWREDENELKIISSRVAVRLRLPVLVGRRR